MNYYEHHLGDYAKQTSHLTMLEHGAYRLLLDRYYSTEEPIPKDQAHRLARARSKDEKIAVDTVLNEFFKFKDGFYWNGRADEELTKARNRINAAQENGRRGGRPKKNPDETYKKPSGLFMGFENDTQIKAHQTPDTKYHLPDSSNNTHSIPSEVVGEISASSVCLLLREMGFNDTNSMHPDLLVALRCGAVKNDFVFAATEAKNRNKGFAYLLRIVVGNMGSRKNASSTSTGNTGCRKLSLVDQAQRDCEIAEQLDRQSMLAESGGYDACVEADDYDLRA